MKRTIIKIDEEKCNGCGDCVTGCHEGALQMIDGKARLVSELYCDGLGACIGECPVGAITLEEREAAPYDEIAVMERVSREGSKVILAHMKHLKDHNEMVYFNQAVEYLNSNSIKIDLTVLEKNKKQMFNIIENNNGGFSGCPGSKNAVFNEKPGDDNITGLESIPSQLTHWPIQMHLLNPSAPHFHGADVVLAADCCAFSQGDFHGKYLKGKKLAIACPKLDSNKEIYVEKLVQMFEEAKINTLTVVIMEVPCCGGLLQITKLALESSQRKVPVKLAVVGIRGDILSEEWTSFN
jgi:NAD-dependent dihydropyrimidine dehydrogenase PreA subunit